MRACMDMDDGADTEILSATLKWSKKKLSDAHIDKRRKVHSKQKKIVVVTKALNVGAQLGPRASELTSHLGSAAKHYCRICMVSNLKIHSHLQNRLLQSNKDTTAHTTSRQRSKDASLTQMGIINQAQNQSVRSNYKLNMACMVSTFSALD